ncbi:PTS IIA-like nitrogen regulatory protein PtsN [Arenicella sp. 4NH20-0111]|uniref:PTS sugar transporter subunit IIA n=1 Tax=Arenicella sp. 4NH20-0111 TaxID=3127648 RepID=UPI003101DB96
MNSTNFLFASLDRERIQVQSEVSSSKRLLQAMSHLLMTGLDEEAKEKDVYHLLLEREKIGNTGVGNGVAIPHSRCDFTDEAVVAIMTMENAVDYDSLDKQPVDIAFGLLVPTEATQNHLNLLADIAKLMSNDSHKKTLASAKTSDEVLNLINHWTTT